MTKKFVLMASLLQKEALFYRHFRLHVVMLSTASVLEVGMPSYCIFSLLGTAELVILERCLCIHRSLQSVCPPTSEHENTSFTSFLDCDCISEYVYTCECLCVCPKRQCCRKSAWCLPSNSSSQTHTHIHTFKWSVSLSLLY